MSFPAPVTSQKRCNSAERDVRVDLAACYRLIELFGMSDLVFEWQALLRRLDRIDSSYRN